MKPATIVIILSVISLSAYGLIKINEITKNVVGGAAFFNEVDAENLEGTETKQFALPGSHCKASFHGTPRIAPISQQLFPGAIQSGELRVIADKKMAYYLAEYRVPSMSIPSVSSFQSSQINIRSFDMKGSNFGNSNLNNQNNSLAQTANYNNDALKAQETLDGYCKNWTNQNGAKVEQNYSVSLKGGLFSGRELTGRMKDGKNCFRLRFFCNYPQKSIVIVGVIGDLNRVRSLDAQSFIDSVDMW
ncbi:MAG: hypothetical protein K2X81_05100 [Candidatus Obscuribacterales bacterium]|nr:hypothetical protein [Candidatus Obscuribacterales bacterium]